MTGIQMSVMTKSGNKAFVFAMASDPFTASPTYFEARSFQQRTHLPPQSVMVVRKQYPARHMNSLRLNRHEVGGDDPEEPGRLIAPTVGTFVWAGEQY